MTDPHPNSDAELVNDYLDGDVDASARARVEASTALSALAAEHRAMRAALGVLPPVPPARRAAALAAAGATYDEMLRDAAGPPSYGTAATAATDELAGRRRRLRRIAGAVAAVAAAVVVVVAAISVGGSSNAPTSAGTATNVPFSQAPPAAAPGLGATQSQPAASQSVPSTPPAGVAGTAETGDDGSAGAASRTSADSGAVVAVDDPTGLLTLVRPAVTSAPAPAAAPSATTLTSTTAAATATTGLAAASVPPGVVAADSAPPEAAGAAPTGVQCLGPDDTVLAFIAYRSTPAVAVVDDRLRVRRALDAETCAVLAEIADTP